MKQRFGAAAETSDLVARLGTWKETPTRTRPPWETLEKAKVWQEARYAPLREVLRVPRQLPVLTTSPAADLRGVFLPDDGAGHCGADVHMFKASAVPEEVLHRAVRLAVVHALDRTRIESF